MYVFENNIPRCAPFYTFNYYPETKRVTDGRTNGHEDPYVPPTLVERVYNNDRCELRCSGSVFSFCSIGNRRVALVQNP